MTYGSVALWIARQYREREFRGRDRLTYYDAPWGIDYDFIVKDDRYLAVHFVVIKGVRQYLRLSASSKGVRI